MIMDEIISECVLPSTEGRAFWKKMFGSRDSVNSTNFCESMLTYYGGGELYEKALNFIFEEHTTISLEDLGNAVQWFGDLPINFYKTIVYLFEKKLVPSQSKSKIN